MSGRQPEKIIGGREAQRGKKRGGYEAAKEGETDWRPLDAQRNETSEEDLRSARIHSKRGQPFSNELGTPQLAGAQEE